MTLFFEWAVLLLVLSCLSITAKNVSDPNNPFIDYVVDLVPFQRAITKVLHESGKLNSEECSIPDGAVIFTLSNHHLFQLILTRQKIMHKAGILSCLEKRFVTVCLDDKCLSMCNTNKVKNCVKIVIPETPMSGFGTHASEYQKNSYNYIVWVKYEMFVASMLVANEVFYFDADVMVYGNPFPEAQWGRDQTGKKIPGPYDIMYQRERGMKEKGCGGSVNGGLWYLHNTTRLFDLWFPKVMQHRADIINLPGRLDQDIVGDYMRLIKYCTLPVRKFMGYCPSSQEPGYDPREIITFHTNCVAGMSSKLDRIREFTHQRFGSAQWEQHTFS
jgi:hypothetical protein